MAQFAIYRVAEQPVAVGDHLPSRLLITSRSPRIPLQRLDPVGETEHQRRRRDLVGQADVGERSKPCRGRPFFDGCPHAIPHSPALALGAPERDAQGIVLPALRRLQTFAEFADKRPAGSRPRGRGQACRRTSCGSGCRTRSSSKPERGRTPRGATPRAVRAAPEPCLSPPAPRPALRSPKVLLPLLR